MSNAQAQSLVYPTPTAGNENAANLVPNLVVSTNFDCPTPTASNMNADPVVSTNLDHPTGTPTTHRDTVVHTDKKGREWFKVKRLAGKRWNFDTKQTQYLVYWYGFPKSAASWEPMLNISISTPSEDDGDDLPLFPAVGSVPLDWDMTSDSED